jgi:transposase InsO family protein
MLRRNKTDGESAADPVNALLHRLYYDVKNSDSAFTGQENVYRAAKRELPSITRRDVREWFETQLTYTLHKPVRYNFARNKTIVLAIDEQWQADLCDMSSRSKDNDGYTFLLTVIDCFSKFAWVEPLMNKTGREILDALKRILQRSGRKPQRLQTDKGTEFLNAQVQRFLQQQNIEFFTTNSEMKAAIAERFNRTYKDKMWKYFTAHNTTRYVDVLQSLVNGYNHSYHRSIKMRPVDVSESDAPLIRQRLYATPAKRKRATKTYKYAIGDLVRISKARRVFRKGYMPNWSEETFIVYNRRDAREPFYYLRDYDGENIKGGFYEREIQRITKQDEYRVEEVLSSKKVRGGKTLYFVKWKGWPEKFNSWVEDIHTLESTT